MNKYLKKGSNIVLLLSVSIFLSCEEVVDELIDCIINKGPVLSMKLLEGGKLNTNYYEYIEASIQNEPSDNDYEYYFDITGDLPNGVEVIIDYRKVIFEGIPGEVGTFDFTVHVTAAGPEYWDEESDTFDDNLCYYSNSKNYSIRIIQ